MNQPLIYKLSWPLAYKAFLFDKDEGLILKLAPVALLLGYPEVVASNLLPVIGEITDLGALAITLLVIFKTFRAIRRHRKVAGRPM